jgi:hypothetical protein
MQSAAAGDRAFVDEEYAAAIQHYTKVTARGSVWSLGTVSWIRCCKRKHPAAASHVVHAFSVEFMHIQTEWNWQHDGSRAACWDQRALGLLEGCWTVTQLALWSSNRRPWSQAPR